MDKKKLVTAALTGMLAFSAHAGDKKAKKKVSASVMGECHGVNSCKGKGDCGGASYTCAGNNSCKGKGWKKLSKAECDQKGGKFSAN